MAYLLGRFKSNWADEMDITGMFICHEDHWKLIEHAARKWFLDEGTMIYFVGTNEEIEYESYEDWRGCFRFSPLSDERTDDLASMLLELTESNTWPFRWSFGHTGVPEAILEERL